MVKTSLKNLMILVFSVSLVIGATLGGGCVGEEIEAPTQQTQPHINEIETPVQETPTQIIEDITPQEAFTLIQNNQNNPDFILLDVRTPEEFDEEHLENAVNLDFYAETFRDWLNILDEDKMYLIYCRSGRRSADVLAMMEELNFKEAYNMLGGIIEWKAGGLPTIQETPIQIIEDITPQEAFTLIQQNQNNPDFVIIDLDSSECFASGHIENAINIDYSSKTIRDELDPLDRDKTYLLYCRCSGRGISGKTADIMAELDFREVYVLLGGLNQWKAEGFPTTK